MARLVLLSSQVVHGTVGLSAMVPALQRLGHEVLAVPTVVLSSHPAPGRQVAGTRIPGRDIAAILSALAANGWLAGVDGMLTGYLPSVEAAEAACCAVEAVESAAPRAILLCDPVLGDDPKGLYIDVAAAEAIRRDLLPRADLATPNRFELAYLTGRRVTNRTEAAKALDCLDCGGGVATSIPGADGYLENVLTLGPCLAATRVPRRPVAPHGTGDLMAALLLAALASGCRPTVALRRATAQVDAVLAASPDSGRLALAALPLDPAPWPVEDWSL